MPEEARAAAKAADKDGNGVIEGDERRELFRSMRPPEAGNQGGGNGGGGGAGDGGGGNGRRNRDRQN
jgi:hypothetical protein